MRSVYSTGGGQASDNYPGTDYYGDAESIKPKKHKSRLFGFGGKKGRKSSQSPPLMLNAAQSEQIGVEKDFVPRETALEAVVRDNPAEMVAYR